MAEAKEAKKAEDEEKETKRARLKSVVVGEV